jgi:hypothetical protein
MDEFLLECCFKACGVESTDSALCNFDSALCNFDSALCCIAQSHDSALCCIARSHDFWRYIASSGVMTQCYVA